MGGGTGARPTLSLPAPGRAACHQDQGSLVGFELVRVSLPLVTPWASAAGTFSHRDSLLVRAVLRFPGPGAAVEAEGWGECQALPGPTFSAEYTAGALDISERYLVPALLRAGTACVAGVAPALAAVKGHNMAKAAFEAAVLDAELRAGGVRMADFLCRQSRIGAVPADKVVAGVAVGLTASLGALLDEVALRREEGYRRVKLKVRPGWDAEPVGAVRERWPDLVLFADANGSYGHLPMGEAVSCLARLDPYELACLEQPLGDDDLAGHAELARHLRSPLGLDEALSSCAAVVNALRAGACAVVNIKAGRLGGYLEAVHAHDVCAEQKVPVWCGGMVETGIARAANLALASLPNFSLPGDLSATGRFFETDLAGPLPLRRDGTIAVPVGPGGGVPIDPGAIERFSTSRTWWGR
ncbi:MAG: o-succinylbenzoate synthase [Acidimicrobiales bacterium]